MSTQPWSCKLVKMTNAELLPWSASKEEVVTGPYHYLKRLPGKDFRPVLIKAFNSVLKVDPKALSIISNVVEMLHTASLLLDDVEDNAELRRGFPVAHSLFGTAQVINSANYMFFVALEELTKLDAPSVFQIYIDELKNLHRGQGMDLYWRETLVCPTEDDYLDMVINKTGGLYRLACRLMQAVSPDPSVDLIPLANVFGVLYQIHDDYLNLQSDVYAKNKGFCEDLTEGKFSFPVIHSIRANPNNKELLNILKQHTTDVSLKQYAVSYMRDQTKSFDYALKTVAEYESLARQLIKDLSAKQDVSQLEAILSRMLAVK